MIRGVREMKMKLSKSHIGIASAGVVLLLAASINAHHSNVTFYLMDQTVEVSGTVKQLRLVNPHINLRLEAAEGEMWVIDGPNATASRQNGWHEGVLKPGEAVTVVGHPGRNPDFRGMYGVRVTKADGTMLQFGRAISP